MGNHDAMLVIKMEAVLPNLNIEKEALSVGGDALVWAAGGAGGATVVGREDIKQIRISPDQNLHWNYIYILLFLTFLWHLRFLLKTFRL